VGRVSVERGHEALEAIDGPLVPVGGNDRQQLLDGEALLERLLALRLQIHQLAFHVGDVDLGCLYRLG
jgi:hypothetical protein